MKPLFLFILALAASAVVLAGCCEPLVPKPVAPAEMAPTEPVPAETLTPPSAEIPVVLLTSDKSSSVSFRFVFRSGSADDPPDKAGLSMLAAKLVAEGGTEQLAYAEVLSKLLPMAAGIHLRIDRDLTVLSGRVHKDHAAAYYEIVRDLLVTPGLRQADFDRVQSSLQVALTKTLRGNDDEELGKAALSWKMYEGHPYRHTPLGTADGLASITLDDAKAQRERIFCAGRLTVGLAGAVPADLADRVRKDLAALPAGCAPETPLSARPAAAGRRVLIVDKPSAEATAISMGFPVDARRGDPDYAALKLVEAYFGQHRTFSGVLQKALRVDRGFNYGNYAYVEHFEQEGWERIPAANTGRREQYFSIWIRPVKEADKHFALRLAVAKLEALVEKGLTAEDFEKTRVFMKRYYLTFAETEEQKLGYAVDDRFYGQSEPYLDMLFRALDALTVADVNAAIRRHLRADTLSIGIVTRNAAAFADAIAGDAPSPVTYVSEKPRAIQDEDKEIAVKKLGIPRDAIEIVAVDDAFSHL